MAKTKRNRSEDMSEGGSEPESDDLKKNKRVKKLASDKAATKNDGNKDNADKFWEVCYHRIFSKRSLGAYMVPTASKSK